MKLTQLMAVLVLAATSGCASLTRPTQEPQTVFNPQWLERCEVGVVCAHNDAQSFWLGVHGGLDEATLTTQFNF